ncbi:hypothetical protein ACFS5M_12240 [Lacinutrix iliipiscaria]|uniref:Uncharacterized protein n=1 Tax=Lacinutrix iliipiscaria TaxID=1230532 RepID=A0ABW5WP32_9FLAO
MNETTIFITIIGLLILVATILILKNKHLKEKQTELDIVKTELNTKYEKLLKEVSTIERVAYDKGYEDSERKNKLTVRIDPIEHESGSNWWIVNNKKIEIGFEYSLLYDNLPLDFKPSRHIIKSIKTSEINEENLQKIISGIETIENLKSGTFLVNKSIKNVKSGLLSKFGKKT